VLDNRGLDQHAARMFERRTRPPPIRDGAFFKNLQVGMLNVIPSPHTVTAPRRWLILAIVSMALLLIVIDVTVLYTALPTLTHDLKASSSAKLWIMNAYTVVVTGLLLGTGTLGDRLGHKRMFMAGLVVFGVASTCAAYSATANILIASRGLLGVGAAMMMPSTLAIIRLMFTDERERTLAIGIWAATAAGGAAFGPVVGGLLLEYFWWGSVFLVNVPVVLTALAFGAWLIPASPGNPQAPWDLTGSFQVMLGLMGLALAVKEMAKRDASLTVILVALVLGTLLLAVFARRQLRSASPLIDFSLFRNVRFSGGVIGAIVASIALVGVELVYSQRLQLVVGLTPLNAGLALLPIPLAALVSGPLTGLLLGRVGTQRIVVISLALVVVSLMGLLLAADTHGMLKMAVLVLLGASVGAAITAASNAVMNNAPPAQAGMAASIEEVSYEMGGALGIAILGSVLTGTYTSAMVVPAHLMTSIDARDSIDAALLAVESMPRPLGEQLLQLAHSAFDQAFGTVILVAVCIVVAAIVSVMLLDRRGQHAPASTPRRVRQS